MLPHRPRCGNISYLQKGERIMNMFMLKYKVEMVIVKI